ncbi:MAG: SpoIIE family protein phosphatase [Bacteroidota bacterium]
MSKGRTARPRTPGDEAGFSHDTLFEFSKVVNSAVDLKFILSHVLLTIMGRLLASRGLALLTEPEGECATAMVKGFPPGTTDLRLRVVRPPRSLLAAGRGAGRQKPWRQTLSRLGVELVLPMYADDRLAGMLCFGGRFSRAPLSPQEKTHLLALANISATAIQKADMLARLEETNRRLDGKIQELNTLFELGKELSAVLDPERLVRTLVFSLLGQIGVSRYLIALRQGPDVHVAASRIDGPPPQGELLASLLRLKGPRLLADVVPQKGTDAGPTLASAGLQVAVPMITQGEARGLLLLGEKLSREPYGQADLEFLFSAANLAIISLENARLFQEAIEKQKMEDELAIAREIQKGLLPRVLPVVGGLEVAAVNISSRQVGGDYYDAIEAPGGKCVFAVGDVSGKGTPASLLMANLQAAIRALVPLDLPLGELTARANDLVCRNTGSDRFITFFWLVMHPPTRSLRYVNAGHNYPMLLRRDGSLERLSRGGMILGVLPSAGPYEEGCTQLDSGDVLVLFTDGVSEAFDPEGREYGEERLQAVVRARASDPAGAILDAVQEDIRNFTRGAPPSDDITLMVLKAV